MRWNRFRQYAIAAIIFGGVFSGALIALSDQSNNDLSLVISTLATISATLVGFAITALSIMLTVGDRRFISNLRKTGHFKNLTDHLLRASSILFFAGVVALVGMFLDGQLRVGCASLSAGVFALGLLSFAGAGRKFSMVIERLD